MMNEALKEKPRLSGRLGGATAVCWSGIRHRRDRSNLQTYSAMSSQNDIPSGYGFPSPQVIQYVEPVS